jgi:hypothetical protein
LLSQRFKLVAMAGGKPFQSKLIPHLELIQQLRKKRVSYPEIARILDVEHGIKVGATTIFDFVKVRSRRSDVYAIAEPDPPPPADPAKIAMQTRQEKLAAAKAAIAARRLAAEQAAALEEGGWADFQRSFDPSKPLKLITPSSPDRPNEIRD